MTRIHNDVMERVVLSLCEGIDTPRALATWLCFKHNQAALLELPPVAVADNDSDAYQLDYFLSEYLSKYKGLKTSIDTKAIALGKWRSAELQCREVNAKFRAYVQRPFSGRVETVLFRTQRKIAHVLGKLHLPLLLADCKWGPGATFDLKGRIATPDNKISRAVSVTPAAAPYLRAVVESDPHWAAVFLGGILPEGPFSFLPSNKWFKLVRGSRFLTVPKSAKTDRCIAAEPTGNSFLQQGVSTYIRRRLKRVGVELDDQSINRRCAQDAYTEGLATLDLSAASDTVSRELIYHLLPIDWACYLDSLRSPETQMEAGNEESWVRTEKFASMGNAFCFDLETLIFWAVSSSVVEIDGGKMPSGSVSRVSVYGDDIIVPQWASAAVIEMLQFCGFTVNIEKSHVQGNFFESCGGHYHRGRDVTPAYQKELVNHPSEFIRAHNRLVRLASRWPLQKVDVLFRAAREFTKRYPLRPFPRIPFGCADDGGFLRPLSEFTLDKNHGYRCHVLDFVPGFSPAREDAMYAYKLRRFTKHSRGKDAGFLGDSSSNQPSNPHPQGYSVNVAQGRWRTRVRWVSELALLSHDSSAARAFSR